MKKYKPVLKKDITWDFANFGESRLIGEKVFRHENIVLICIKFKNVLVFAESLDIDKIGLGNKSRFFLIKDFKKLIKNAKISFKKYYQD